MEASPVSGCVWLVVLVRPTGEADLADAKGSRMFPTLLARTSDREEAYSLAQKLREEGALVAVIEEQAGSPTTCERHPAHLLGRTCGECGQALCAQCFAEASGRRLCADCAQRHTKLQRQRRVRQLFALFLFSVFCFKAVAWMRSEADHLDPAQGIEVAVFQFGLEDDLSHPLVKALNDPDNPHALRAIQGWYNQEYARFTGATQPMLRVRVFGPWSTAVAPPRLEEPEASWWRIAWTSWSFTRYWHGLARDFGAEPDDWDARIYLVYGRTPGDLASDSRGSTKGRIAVAFVSLQEPDPAYAQLTVAHELGHILGADDLYDPTTFLSTVPQGLAEPNRRPMYPQRYAEVMAVDRPLSPIQESPVRGLEEVRVGFHSAARMGWADPEQAESYYSPVAEVALGPPEAAPR